MTEANKKDNRKTAILADSELERVSGGFDGGLSPDLGYEITHNGPHGCGRTYFSHVEKPEKCIFCGRPFDWDFGPL